MGRALLPAGIAGDNHGYALHVLEHALHAPETAASEHRLLGSRLCGPRLQRWGRDDHRGFGLTLVRWPERQTGGNEHEAESKRQAL